MDRIDVVDVMCLALPDGQTFWFEADGDYARKCVLAWKGQLSQDAREKYEAAGVLGGVVTLRMLREDYQRIPATNAIPWPGVRGETR